MSEKSGKLLIFGAAIFMIAAASILYYVFDKQGYGKDKVNRYVSYNASDYVEVVPVNFGNYSDVYSSIDVSKIKFKNLDSNIVNAFLTSEEELIDYVSGYYSETKSTSNYRPVSTASSSYKALVTGAVLSVLYRIDFTLDENIFPDQNRTYLLAINIDLGTNRLLTTDDLLTKYNYSKKYIAEKLYEEDILISNGQIVIDKNTNISLTKNDIARKKNEYIERIISDFDNIITMYIENNSLVLSYDKKELNGLFFEDDDFVTDIKIRYLK